MKASAIDIYSEFSPLDLAETIKKRYAEYILNTFPIEDVVLREKFQTEIMNNRLLWNGPFISLAKKYKKTIQLREFCTRNSIDSAVADSFPIEDGCL